MSWPDHFKDSWSSIDSEMEFMDQMKAPIFLITPVQFYLQQMLFVKVIAKT